jgi:hypothetical protein
MIRNQANIQREQYAIASAAAQGVANAATELNKRKAVQNVRILRAVRIWENLCLHFEQDSVKFKINTLRKFLTEEMKDPSSKLTLQFVERFFKDKKALFSSLYKKITGLPVEMLPIVLLALLPLELDPYMAGLHAQPGDVSRTGVNTQCSL